MKNCYHNLGVEVAKFVENHFIEELLKKENFKNKNYGAALEETFYTMDDLLKADAG